MTEETEDEKVDRSYRIARAIFAIGALSSRSNGIKLLFTKEDLYSIVVALKVSPQDVSTAFSVLLDSAIFTDVKRPQTPFGEPYEFTLNNTGASE